MTKSTWSTWLLAMVFMVIICSNVDTVEGSPDPVPATEPVPISSALASDKSSIQRARTTSDEDGSLDEEVGQRFSPSLNSSLFSSTTISYDPYVDILQGTVIGRIDLSEQGAFYKSFQGIPYGKIVRRFDRAVEADKFETGVFSALTYGPICPQMTPPFPVPEGMSENCLSVNVFAPVEGKNLAVMVWIHRGSFAYGSGGNFYYGPEFFMDYGVILVTFNYRLGQFGFLSLETEELAGNVGLWDQNLALQWVNRNIQFFGGDRSRITIFGESAGSYSVMYHLVSPKSAGLFSAAIAQSGGIVSTISDPQSPGHARRVAIDLAASLGCETHADADIMECLRGKTSEELLSQEIFCESCISRLTCFEQKDNICTLFPWNAVVDGSFSKDPFIPEHPANLVKGGQLANVPMIVGVNSEEGSWIVADRYIKHSELFSELNEDWNLYGPLWIFDKADNVTDIEKEVSKLVRTFYLGKDEASMENIHAVIDMFSDMVIWTSSHHFVDLAVRRQTAPIYQYVLTYKATNTYPDLELGIDSESLGLKGVSHVDDLYHLFKIHLHSMTFSEEDITVRENMLNWWTNFAKNRQPDENDTWQSVKPGQLQYLNISLSPHMDFSPKYKNRMEFWTCMLKKINYP